VKLNIREKGKGEKKREKQAYGTGGAEHPERTKNLKGLREKVLALKRQGGIKKTKKKKKKGEKASGRWRVIIDL